MTFEFTLEETNLVLNALGRMPYESVFQLIDNLRNQATPQLPAVQAAAEEASNTVPGSDEE